MKPTDDMGELIKKLNIKASSELDRKVHNDISKAMAKPKPAAGPNIWRTKLAAAAAIIIAFGVGFFIGQKSRPTESEIYSADVASHTHAMSAYQTDESGFWRQKVLAAIQPRPYTQNRFDQIGLLKTYRQYLKEKNYD
jgi:hypothetical protein